MARSILVVEPEMLIGMVLADFLQECGLDAYQVSRGSEAARVLERPIDIDAVVTDLLIPHAAEGLSLVLWLFEHRPGLKVDLAMSDAAKVSSVKDLCAVWSGGPTPYDLAAAVSQMRSIVDTRHQRETAMTATNVKNKPFVSEYLLRRTRSLREICARVGRCPAAPPYGYCRDCPRLLGFK